MPFLASIESDDENNFIKDLLVDKNAEIAYIGLQSVPYNVAHRYFSDGTTLGYTNWAPGKPDNDNLMDDGCVVIDAAEGQWDDWTCSANMVTGPWATVCQTRYLEKEDQKEEANCPTGFAYDSISTKCYKVIIKAEGITAWNAKIECANYNSQLVAINSKEENQFISNLAMKHPLSAMRVFIGLESDRTNLDARNRYWIDDTWVEQRYVNWEYDKPDNVPYYLNDCVVMIPERNGVWDDWACNLPRYLEHAVYGAVCEFRNE
ncbi:hypothetical protein LOAG_14118 [Loa loa]|uniref:C-type lectin domain-containing protein n=1 Tax=Loa loa TaxID=7209 RepID=A0A1S0TIT3_LOALO|nr:hypothetical protein LOAG_14118 [Loa loa]EFO14402.2 hypothetical protein LOAG_14118 [Loa loa]